MDALQALSIVMREGGLLAPVAEPVAARWIADIEAFETEGFVTLRENVPHDDTAREALRGAAHTAAARPTRPGSDLPRAVRSMTTDVDELRRVMLRATREPASCLDRWYTMDGVRAPAA